MRDFHCELSISTEVDGHLLRCPTFHAGGYYGKSMYVKIPLNHDMVTIFKNLAHGVYDKNIRYFYEFDPHISEQMLMRMCVNSLSIGRNTYQDLICSNSPDGYYYVLPYNRDKSLDALTEYLMEDAVELYGVLSVIIYNLSYLPWYNYTKQQLIPTMNEINYQVVFANKVKTWRHKDIRFTFE